MRDTMRNQLIFPWAHKQELKVGNEIECYEHCHFPRSTHTESNKPSLITFLRMETTIKNHVIIFFYHVINYFLICPKNQRCAPPTTHKLLKHERNLFDLWFLFWQYDLEDQARQLLKNIMIKQCRIKHLCDDMNCIFHLKDHCLSCCVLPLSLLLPRVSGWKLLFLFILIIGFVCMVNKFWILCAYILPIVKVKVHIMFFSLKAYFGGAIPASYVLRNCDHFLQKYVMRNHDENSTLVCSARRKSS